MRHVFVLLGLAMLLAACADKGNPPIAVEYPDTRKDDTVDDYHGTEVADPYRWLEDDNSEETKAWVQAQNAATRGYLNQISYRDQIKERLEELYNYPRQSAPFRIGEYYFFYKNDGLQNQSVLYRQTGLDGEAEVFLDPNTYSDDGTVALSIAGVSKNDKYMVIAQQDAGSDWRSFWVMEVESGNRLPDELKWIKFSGASWYKDGFFYSRYDEPAQGQALDGANQGQKVYYHKLGTPQSADRLIHEDPEHPNYYFGVSVTEDEQHMLLNISKGTYGNELHHKFTNAMDAEWRPIVTGFEQEYGIIHNEGNKVWMRTDDGAPNNRVVSFDITAPEKENWTDVLPNTENKLASVGAAGGKLFAIYSVDVADKAYQYSLAGEMEREIALPTMGNVGGFGGEMDDTVLFYSFSSFTYPSTVFKYEVASGTSEPFFKSNVAFNPDEYETRQVFYKSKDGTEVPMFITHKKGLELDGNRPTLLYAYGGFNISVGPSFSASSIVLLENGGVYAVANIRGGGEYGEAWHEAGMLEKKQNVFDDFIAAGEYLISEGYASNNTLAIRGGSNGGLLVGACMTQRPDLYAVCFPAVGVMDMLRYHKFTIGYAWAVEYGSSDDAEAFKYLYAYSPLHNLEPGTSYPATMVTTADHDDRVVPAHSFKFAATLQAMHAGQNPVLIRIEERAGHGSGKPISKTIEEQADIWAFMFYNTGVSELIYAASEEPSSEPEATEPENEQATTE